MANTIDVDLDAADAHHGRGIGTLLLEHLAALAVGAAPDATLRRLRAADPA